MNWERNLERVVEKMSVDEYKLRVLLWLRHGCDLAVLYGDDGERQCNACMIDFIRMSVEEIRQKFEDIGMKKLIESGIAKKVEKENPNASNKKEELC